MAIASIIVSVIALLVSLIVAWRNYLKPFDVSLVSGNPRFEQVPVDLPGGGHVMRFSVVLPIQFVNRGAQGGLVRDIVLVVHSKDAEWLLYPAFFCTYDTSTEATLGASLTTNPLNVPFYPVHLEGRQTTYKAIIFVPDATNRWFPMGSDELRSGNYQITVKTLANDSPAYAVRLALSVTLGDAQIAGFSKGTRVMHMIPFADEIRDKRQALRPSRK